jgi:hypothetical protein
VKYIRYDSLDIIMFGDHVPHSTIHQCLSCRSDLISAGFVNPQTWECYGESVSLKRASLKEDTDILRIQNHIHDIPHPKADYQRGYDAGFDAATGADDPNPMC